MADLKISQLTGATTPLAGTEVVPLVQSGTTKKVAVSSLTAGRAVDGLSFNATDLMKLTKTGSGTLTSGPYYYFNSGNGSGDGTILQLNATNGLDVWGSTGGAWTKNFTFDVGGNLIPLNAGRGVNFTANTPAAGMTSRLLNWYEEGTWTPTDTSGAGLTFASADGYYTRIGRQVFAHYYITYPSTANASANGIGGLPFTAANVNAARGGSTLTYHEFNAVTSIYGPKNGTGFQLVNGVGNALTNATCSGKTIMGCIVYFI